MLPVVKGEAQTAKSIVTYSIVLFGISLLPFLSNTLGVFYLACALALGLAFLAFALVLRRHTTPANARRLFSFSLAYLALLFVAMALDPILF
jgi:protoheme IX farnesyltransferase